MLKELENLEEQELQLMSRKSLEKFAWREKEIISLLKDELSLAASNNQELKDKTQNLEDVLEKFRRIIFGKSSEKSDKPDETKPTKKISSGGGGNASTRKLPSERYPNLEVVNIDRVVEHLPECACCGNTMKDSGLREVTEQLHIIPRKYQIQRIFNPKFHCKECHSGLKIFSIPRIKSGSSFSDDFIIDVVASKYADLVPIGRYADLAETDGGLTGIAPHSLIELTHHLAEFCAVVVQRIRESLLTSIVLHADETPHRMLEEDDNSSWYLWGFCDGKNSYFEIHSTRAGEVALKILSSSHCIALVSDVFSGYGKAVREANKLRPSHLQILNAYCNAHARRLFIEAEKAYPQEAKFYINEYREIYKKESELKTQIETICETPQPGLRKVQEVHFQTMLAKCEVDIKTVSNNSSLAKAINYFVKNYKGLTECLRHTEIPLDNNLQERQLRRPVVGRKTWYGTHSKRGAETAAALFTITQSCRLCGVNVREYLKAVTLSLHSKGPPFTPHEYSLLKNKSKENSA